MSELSAHPREFRDWLTGRDAQVERLRGLHDEAALADFERELAAILRTLSRRVGPAALARRLLSAATILAEDGK
ncbi:MAG: hypothetical protein AAF676_01745 [Pseudomonadota bacterium]